MKRGQRKNWEMWLEDAKSGGEHQSIYLEWYEEWKEFDKESYRMSAERYAKHLIELEKIKKYEEQNIEWYKEVEKRFKRINEMEGPVKVHNYWESKIDKCKDDYGKARIVEKWANDWSDRDEKSNEMNEKNLDEHGKELEKIHMHVNRLMWQDEDIQRNIRMGKIRQKK